MWVYSVIQCFVPYCNTGARNTALSMIAGVEPRENVKFSNLFDYCLSPGKFQNVVQIIMGSKNWYIPGFHMKICVTSIEIRGWSIIVQDVIDIWCGQAK